MTELERRVLHVVHAYNNSYPGIDDVASILVEDIVEALADRGVAYRSIGSIWLRPVAKEALDFCRWHAGLPSLFEISRQEARVRLSADLAALSTLRYHA